MFQVRIHGRGGQGVVTTAELLSVAAFCDNRWAQAIPSFGSKRTGAPVVSFCRIDNKQIRLREPIVEPDAVIINDPTLLHQVPVFDGMSPNTYLLINTTRSFDELSIVDFTRTLAPGRAIAVPAAEFATRHLGRPLPGAALLGAFAALTGQISLNSVLSAIHGRFTGGVMTGNAEAATAAYEFVTTQRKGASREEALT